MQCVMSTSITNSLLFVLNTPNAVLREIVRRPFASGLIEIAPPRGSHRAASHSDRRIII